VRYEEFDEDDDARDISGEHWAGKNAAKVTCAT
jgi:hypothetical protein